MSEELKAPTNWPDPNRPGVPLLPERDGWHAIGLTIKQVKWWDAANKYWWDSERRYYLTLDEVAFRVPEYRYIGPVLTPTQITEMLAAERKRCADVCKADAHRYREAGERKMDAASFECSLKIRKLGDAP